MTKKNPLLLLLHCLIALIPFKAAPSPNRSIDGSEYCSICLAGLTESAELKTLEQCKHRYHRECINTWLQDKNICPVCRNEVGPDELPTAENNEHHDDQPHEHVGANPQQNIVIDQGMDEQSPRSFLESVRATIMWRWPRWRVDANNESFVFSPTASSTNITIEDDEHHSSDSENGSVIVSPQIGTRNIEIQENDNGNGNQQLPVDSDESVVFPSPQNPTHNYETTQTADDDANEHHLHIQIDSDESVVFPSPQNPTHNAETVQTDDDANEHHLHIQIDSDNESVVFDPSISAHEPRQENDDDGWEPHDHLLNENQSSVHLDSPSNASQTQSRQDSDEWQAHGHLLDDSDNESVYHSPVVSPGISRIAAAPDAQNDVFYAGAPPLTTLSADQRTLLDNAPVGSSMLVHDIYGHSHNVQIRKI